MDEPIRKSILAIDPGKMTGVCILEAVISNFSHWIPEELNVLNSSEFAWDNRFEAVTELMKRPFDYFVIEDFKVYLQKATSLAGHTLFSAELIGMFEFNRVTYHPELYPMRRQMASERKVAIPPRDFVTSCKGSQHKIDSYQHAKLFAISRLPTIIKREAEIVWQS